jgi:dTDP-glucose 4,6-dehydratase
MAILITGGTGFIGANFIIDWFKQSEELIINIDKLTYAGDQNKLMGIASKYPYEFLQADIADKEIVDVVLEKHRPRAIFNFAAETHVDRSILNPKVFFETNVLGTLNLLEQAKAYWQKYFYPREGGFLFVQISTDEVFGTLRPKDPPFSEKSPYAPNNPYSASKASSDHIVRSFFKTYNFPAVIANCSNNYGPFQHSEKLIPLMITNALKNKPLPIYGTGDQIRDWLYVEDNCSGLRRVFERGKIGESYNLGGNSERQNIEVVAQICSLLDRKVPRGDGNSYFSLVKNVEDRLGHDRRYAICCNKIERDLGWCPSVSFERGLEQTVDWYLANI